MVIIKKGLNILVLSVFSFGVIADTQRGEIQPWLVYEIGGKAKVKQRRNFNIPVGTGIRWKMPQCGNFDMSLSITNIMNGITSDLENIGKELVASATGAVSNWPMTELARTDPQLYEMIQQGKLEASELFNTSVSSCEAVSSKVIKDGYGTVTQLSSWVDTSQFEAWASAASSNDDIVQVDENIKKDAGKDGVTWMGGDKKGGENQAPIEVEKDAVRAGYNQLASRNVNDKSQLNANADKTPWYAKYWESPKEAEEWISSVVGTTTIRTCEDCGERLKTVPGKGVYPKIEEEQRRIEKLISKLVDNPKIDISKSDLDEVSAPGYEMTLQVIEGLRGEGVYRSVLIERLAEEVAITGTVERLIAARRLLLSGKREAYIAQNAEASKILDSRIGEIGAEMELLRQDAELRTSTKDSVAVKVLERLNQRSMAPSPSVAPTDISDALRDISGRK